MSNGILDTSSELLLHPWGNGFKLIRPDDPLNNIYQLSLKSVGEVFNSSLHLYFLNAQSRIQNMNETSMLTCGYPSLKKAVGKTRELVADKQAVERITREDQLVIKNQEMQLFEEVFVRLDEVHLPCLAFKFPWYDANNRIIGLFGCSIVLNQDNLFAIAQSMSEMIQLGLLTSPKALTDATSILPGKQTQGIYLTKRESECLNLLARGKNTKMIANMLELSPRTVEYYIENAKVKFNVRYRSELIEKYISG